MTLTSHDRQRPSPDCVCPVGRRKPRRDSGRDAACPVRARRQARPDRRDVRGRDERGVPLTGLLGFLGTRDHLVPASGLRRLIARHIEHEALENLPIPLHVVAVDVISGEELRLSQGSVADAVMASVAIPGVVAPVRWEDRNLSDARLIVLPPPCPLSIQPIDFAHADELISRSLSEAREFLNAEGEERPPIKMRPHRHRGAK